jgi:hypothetical protein
VEIFASCSEKSVGLPVNGARQLMTSAVANGDRCCTRIHLIHLLSSFRNQRTQKVNERASFCANV